MRDFVRQYGKIAGAFAAGAFLLSLLIGLFTRHPFGTALLRAFLLAVFFGALGGALRFAILKYLPELFPQAAERVSSPGPARGEDGRGSTVDIVLPEEFPGGRAPGALSDELTLEEESGRMPLGAANEMPLGAADEMPPGAAGESFEEAAEEASDVLDEAGEPEPAHAFPDGGRGLDALPDIASLEETVDRGHAKARPASSGPRARMPGGDRPQDALRDAVSGQDPSTIAKAIRTILKRDGKG